MKRSLAPTTLENFFSFSPPPFLSFFHASLSPSNMESFDRGAERSRYRGEGYRLEVVRQN